MSNKTAAALSGFIGACTLTLIHESVRRIVPAAPRMDILGMRAIARTLRKADVTPPDPEPLHAIALVGDVLSNSAYYSLVGAGNGEGDGALLRGTLLGAAAGVGAVLLPGPLGLGDGPSRRTTATVVMTIGWYTAGGVAAAVAYRCLAKRER